MTAESKVRIAGPQDGSEIFRLFLQGHAENGLFPYDLEKVQWWMNRMLQPELIPSWDTGTRGAIGVIGEVGHLEGLAFLTFGCFWYTNHRHLEEFLVYVDPPCRNSEHGKALIGWMKEQSVLTGLPLMTGILSMGERLEAKIRMYRRELPQAGAFFFYSPTLGSSMSIVLH